MPPFITSTLAAGGGAEAAVQREADHDAGAKLYEGVELGDEEGAVGLISYMRTDSTRVSDDALDEVRAMIERLRSGLPAGKAERL